MNALLLPGNSLRHSEWIEDLKLAVADHFQYTVTQHYKHWQAGGGTADIDYEIGVAQAKAKDLDPYVIIAKSIGTVIAVKGVVGGALRPQKLILLGVPIRGGASKVAFSDWLQNIDVEVVMVQNANDPLGSFTDVQDAFKGAGERVAFVELPGKTHDYVDFTAITRLI